MKETTYIVLKPYTEVMVNTDETGVTGIYTYAVDASAPIFKTWKAGRNPVFVHCPKDELTKVFKWLEKNGVKGDDE